MAVLLKCIRFLRLSPTHLPYKLLSTCSPPCTDRNGLVLGVYSDECKEELILTPTAEKYNKSVDGQLLNSLTLIEKIKEGKSYVFWCLDKQYQAVAVVGLGKKCQGYDKLEMLEKDKEAVRVAASAGCKSLQEIGIRTICLEDLGDAEAAGEGGTLGLWKFQECKTKQECPPAVNLYSGSDCNIELFRTGVIKANAQNFARQLTDMPSNLMTPTIFTQRVEEAFAGLDVCIQVHDEEWAKKKHMNAFLAVTQGSCEPAKFIELDYNKGNSDDGPYTLVGKGVTFDTGGISLKPASKMDEMRGDMGGAASCVAALKALACLNTQANIKVLIPLTENMPSGKAIKPGDVVRAMNGKSICINNTDAEGRLILADALAYSCYFKPKWVMDVATLTGAMRVALGSAASGVFTNSDRLYQCLEKAGAVTGDRVWRMPLWNHYKKQICENTGYDLCNIGNAPGGGSCTAAAFLQEFMPPKVDWLHVDIAGVSGPESNIPYLGKGMTGRPTRTIIEFIDSQTRTFC
ncbi:hypothetical protein ILUMI_12599 [Ignelater luminosus]|uniref:Cytosol aminopeptidase n=1 Tax=Ignelater luminosus TaxID=2038154 RepID=A0A8K0CTW5_IGNLU|nr:hypothetical protein ILUMI_12599 [Ignelater luminosus]